MSNESNIPLIPMSNPSNKQSISGLTGPIGITGFTGPNLNPQKKTNSVPTQIITPNNIIMTVGIDPNGNTVYNGWTDNNTDTVRAWKTNVQKSGFVYNTVLTKYTSLNDGVLKWVMILGYIVTLLSSVITALLAISSKYIWVSFGFSVASLTLTCIITILNSLLKISGWSDLITKYARFLDRLNDFYALVSNTLLLPAQLRVDAPTFIQKQNATYLDINMSIPVLSQSDYNYANKKYADFIQDNETNYILAAKYNQNDAIIDII